jgi:hypothetical protein
MVLLVTSRRGQHRKHRFIISVHLLPWKHACLRSRYLATAVVYLLLSWSLPSNGSTCHSTVQMIYPDSCRAISKYSLKHLDCKLESKFRHCPLPQGGIFGEPLVHGEWRYVLRLELNKSHRSSPSNFAPPPFFPYSPPFIDHSFHTNVGSVITW